MVGSDLATSIAVARTEATESDAPTADNRFFGARPTFVPPFVLADEPFPPIMESERHRQETHIMAVVTILIGISLATAADSAPKKVPLAPKVAKRASETIDRAIGYLRKTQNPDGSFAEAELALPITGLVAAAVLRTGRVTPADPLAGRALAFIEKHVQADGGIYSKAGLKNYPTAICTMALVEANRDGRYRTAIDKAVTFLKAMQWDETEGISTDNPKYGGAGYGRKSRPDLSNTSFLLEALEASGVPKDDPAYKRALVFVTRCQNFTGEGGNDQPQAKLIDDGGFYYTAAEDYNPGGGTTDKGLRSYGSMTYAGLKSFVYAGLKKDDPRVQAALGWIRKNYTLEKNPGLGAQGLYYYYHTFAKALDALDVDMLKDAAGKSHDWRADLVATLAAKQKPDGSWTNEAKRWYEGNPRLVTAYALLALSHATER